MKPKILPTIVLLSGILPMIIGSIIFWVWFFYPSINELEEYGIQTIRISIPVCTIGLLIAFIIKSNKSDSRKPGRRRIRLMLIILGNIPLSIFYLWFVFYILDTERITIINNSNSEINDIHLFGVGNNNSVSRLADGQSKTVWVHMNFEGALQMSYAHNTHVDTVIVNGYTGPGMGGNWVDYSINCTEGD